MYKYNTYAKFSKKHKHTLIFDTSWTQPPGRHYTRDLKHKHGRRLPVLSARHVAGYLQCINALWPVLAVPNDSSWWHIHVCEQLVQSRYVMMEWLRFEPATSWSLVWHLHLQIIRSHKTSQSSVTNNREVFGHAGMQQVCWRPGRRPGVAFPWAGRLQLATGELIEPKSRDAMRDVISARVLENSRWTYCALYTDCTMFFNTLCELCNFYNTWCENVCAFTVITDVKYLECYVCHHKVVL